MPIEQTHTGLAGWAPRAAAELGFELNGVAHRLVRRASWPAQAAAEEIVGQMTVAGEQHLILRASPPAGPAKGAPVPLSRILTHREIEIAILMAEGQCDKQIARALGISGHTVREYTRRAMGKLKVSKRTAIVSYVLNALSLGGGPD